MKVYLYCPESGIYQGETFTNESLVCGGMNMPVGSTALAPPPYTSREVPVFLRSENRWEVRPLSSMRRSLTAEVTGRSAPGAPSSG